MTDSGVLPSPASPSSHPSSSPTMSLNTPSSALSSSLTALVSAPPVGYEAVTTLHIQSRDGQYSVRDVRSRLEPLRQQTPTPPAPAPFPYKFAVPPPQPPQQQSYQHHLSAASSSSPHFNSSPAASSSPSPPASQLSAPARIHGKVVFSSDDEEEEEMNNAAMDDGEEQEERPPSITGNKRRRTPSADIENEGDDASETNSESQRSGGTPQQQQQQPPQHQHHTRRSSPHTSATINEDEEGDQPLSDEEGEDKQQQQQQQNENTKQPQSIDESGDEMQEDEGEESKSSVASSPTKKKPQDARSLAYQTMNMPTNKSSCTNFNQYLQKVRGTNVTLLDLTKEELIEIVPTWILEARTLTGQPYKWDTFKSYLNAISRVLRTMQPASEWANYKLQTEPRVAQAVATVRAKEEKEAKPVVRAVAAPSTPFQPSIHAPAAAPSSASKALEMTTRRAGRIANGEVPINYAHTNSPPGSAPSSPKHGATNADETVRKPGPGSHIQRLSPEQETFILSQLDPGVPEGLLRMNFINIQRYFGIVYVDEHRDMKIRNFMLGRKEVKVRYLTPSNAAAAPFIPPAAVAAPVAASSDPMKHELNNNDGPVVKMEVDEEGATASSASQPLPAHTNGGAELQPQISDAVTAAVLQAAASATALVSDSAPVTATTTASPPVESSAPAVPDTNGDTTMGETEHKDAIAPHAVAAAAAAAAAAFSAPTAQADIVPPVAPTDPNTPFEVCHPADPLGIMRSVSFLLFLPSAGSRRHIGFMYERPWEGELCPIALWNSYISHRPPVTSDEASLSLWLTPRKQPTVSEWYMPTPIGRNKLRAVITTLTVGCGLPPVYSNQSLLHQPKMPIALSTEEIEQMKDVSEKSGYNIPTKEQHAAIVAAKMTALAPPAPAAAPKQQSAANQSAGQSSSSKSHHQPSSSPHHSQPSHHSQHQQQQYQMHPQVPYSTMPQTYIRANPQGVIYMPTDPTFLLDQQKHQQFYSQLDEAILKQRAGEAGTTTRSMEVPSLLSPSFMLSSASALQVPPATSSATAITSTASSASPMSLSDTGSLLSFLSTVDSDIATLTHATSSLQTRLGHFRSLATSFRTDATSQLKLTQQQAKIAEQYAKLQEQQAELDELRAKVKAGGMNATDMHATHVTNPFTDQPLHQQQQGHLPKGEVNGTTHNEAMMNASSHAQ